LKKWGIPRCPFFYPHVFVNKGVDKHLFIWYNVLSLLIQPTNIRLFLDEERSLGKRYRTGDQALVREINLSIILNCLRETSPLSRAQLAEITGLNKTTVSSLVRELIARQFVREIGFDLSGGGRPPVLLELNPDAGCIIGMEIGVDFILAILTDFKAQVLWRHRENTDQAEGQEAILTRALDIVRQTLTVGGSTHSPVLGIGIGVPGLVDVSSGTLLFAPNLKWHDVPLREVFSQEFDVPVFVDNEANVAALGERYFGTAQGSRDFVYLSIGVGLGGGIVLDGQLYRGIGGYAGEIGHMTLTSDGERCNCGNCGCWETLVSQMAVVNRVRKAVEAGNASRVSQLVKGRLERISIPLIVEAAEEGDEVAGQALEETGVYLGIGIANLINAFNPELVIFGGVMSLASAYLLPAIEKTLEGRSLAWPRRMARVMASSYGPDACVMGGVALVLHDILSRPDLVA
jgi:glucokinase-like ROK family protein